MKSQLFPQLDKGCVDRLLRSGLQVSPNESALLHATSRLTQLGILKTVEVHAIYCANPADSDFPEDVLDESCPGIIKLATPRLSISQRHPSYQCHDCGRIVEYPGVQKEVFRRWETAVNPEGVAAYVGMATKALTGDSGGSHATSLIASPNALAYVGLSVSDLLTTERTWLAQNIASVPTSGSAHHRQRSDLTELCASLLDAFPTKQLFAEMVRFELDRSLDAIALGDNLAEIVKKVILLAEREGWLDELIEAAKRANSGNHRLGQLSQLRI